MTLDELIDKLTAIRDAKPENSGLMVLLLDPQCLWPIKEASVQPSFPMFAVVLE